MQYFSTVTNFQKSPSAGFRFLLRCYTNGNR